MYLMTWRHEDSFNSNYSLTQTREMAQGTESLPKITDKEEFYASHIITTICTCL